MPMLIIHRPVFKSSHKSHVTDTTNSVGLILCGGSTHEIDRLISGEPLILGKIEITCRSLRHRL